MEADGSSHTPGWFDLGRTPPFPSQYGENKTPVTADVLEVGIIVAFVAVIVSLACLLPSIHGLKQLVWFSRCTLTLLLGVIIMVCNFGQMWEVGIIESKMAYRAGTGQEVNANIAIWMGLRGLNITLKNITEPEGDLRGETINYNERFTWTWTQGRPGFGPFAGEIQRQFRAAQYRGTPIPILWVAEYFTIDGEGLRWGRHYRQAGWYAHMCIWAALPSWALSIILFKMVIKYGAQMLCLTGSLLLSAAIIWATLRNPLELKIPFDNANLVTKFGPHWYMALIAGSVCIIIGIMIHILDDYYHDTVSAFFTIDPHHILDVEYIDEGGVDSGPRSPTQINQPTNEHEMEELVQPPTLPSRQASVRIRGRGSSDKNWQKYTVSKTESNTFVGQDQALYSNVPNIPSEGFTTVLTNVQEDIEEPLYSNVPHRPPKRIINEVDEPLYSNVPHGPPEGIINEVDGNQPDYQDASSLHVGDDDATKILKKYSTTKNEYNTFGQDKPPYSNVPHNLSEGFANVLSEVQEESLDSHDPQGSPEGLINASYVPDDDQPEYEELPSTSKVPLLPPRRPRIN